MISLHKHTTNSFELANGWYVPSSSEPENWEIGQTQKVEWNIISLTRAICALPWSPIIWRGGQRAERNFVSAQLIALDFDDGKTLRWAEDTFDEKKHIIGTTKSHQIEKNGKPACDRFRVILFLQEPITSLSDYKKVMAWYVRRFESDEKCKDGARFFFPCKNIVQSRTEVAFSGKDASYALPNMLEVETKVVAVPERPMQHIRSEISQRYENNSAKPHKKNGCRKWLAGAGFHHGSRNGSAFQAACDLAECGWSEHSIVDWLIGIGTDLDTNEVVSCVRSATKHKQK